MSETGQQTLEKCLSNSDIMKAEIIWSLHSVSSGFSFRCNDKLADILYAMFPDSAIDSAFRMNRTKSEYVVNHRLAQGTVE